VLRTLGVAAVHLEDATQDVFVIVHQRLATFEGRAAVTTWLFAIARGVASTYRRRAAAIARGTGSSGVIGGAEPPRDPFAELARAEAAAAVLAILDDMDEDQRVVFALVEIEQLAMPEVARALEVGLNTAYSRLRLARRAFAAAALARAQIA
jgi:RNA polymerase sigma-70 factor (ECF subfamily)